MEEALSQDPRILDEIVDDLILLLSHEDDGLRGDTSELLGKVCLPKAIPHLERLRDDPNEDVRDAAIEALGVLEKST
jgi:HEAT repeat protein